jgi:hypothetical protein
MIYMNQIDIRIGLDVRRGGSFTLGIGWFTVAPCQQISAKAKQDRGMTPETD